VHEGERGYTLIEAVVAGAIVAMLCAAVLGAFATAAHRFAGDPIRDALESLVRNELRIAADLAKYQDASLRPASIATTVPMPSASPLAVQLTMTIATTSGSTDVTISAVDAADATEAVTASAQLAPPVPPPGASVPAAARGSAPQ
jgi:type II secretory pathway pseudopilin PulG